MSVYFNCIAIYSLLDNYKLDWKEHGFIGQFFVESTFKRSFDFIDRTLACQPSEVNERMRDFVLLVLLALAMASFVAVCDGFCCNWTLTPVVFAIFVTPISGAWSNNFALCLCLCRISRLPVLMGHWCIRGSAAPMEAAMFSAVIATNPALPTKLCNESIR